MNEQIPLAPVRTTQFAEGLPRRCWSVTEFEKMAAIGLFSEGRLEDERLELLRGDIVPRSPQTPRHELVRSELYHRWAGLAAYRIYKVATFASFIADDHSYLFPDFSVIADATDFSNITPETVLLIVEVAEPELAKDLKYKTEIYAAAGIPDYWVINAATLVTTVFRDPTDAGYRSRTEIASDQPLTPLAAPELAIALDELGIR